MRQYIPIGLVLKKIYLRTSDSLNEGLPIKMAKKSFNENDIFP